MKSPYLGKNGHIAIRTNYIDRAVNYLSTVLGVEFNEESAKRDAKGGLKAIYPERGDRRLRRTSCTALIKGNTANQRKGIK